MFCKLCQLRIAKPVELKKDIIIHIERGTRNSKYERIYLFFEDITLNTQQNMEVKTEIEIDAKLIFNCGTE